MEAPGSNSLFEYSNEAMSMEAAKGEGNDSVVPSARYSEGDDESIINRSISPDDDIEIVNFQDYVSLNVNRYDFSQVIFVEVKEYYEPGERVFCRYKVTGGLYPHAKDKVCLFRLGWISAQDYKVFVHAPMPPKYQAGMIFDSVVTFEGSEVAEQDSDDYYQFCYINHQDQIRGASTPFQFKTGYSNNEAVETSPTPSATDICTVQELKDRIDRLSQEKGVLVQKNAEKENEIFECAVKIEELENKLVLHAETVESENQQRIQIDELNVVMNEMQVAFSKEKNDCRVKIEELESELDKAKTLNSEQMESYSVLLKQIAKLQKEKTETRADIESLIAEKECLQKLHCELEGENEKLLKQIESLQEEQESLSDMLSHRNEDIDSLMEKLSNAETSVDMLKRDLEEQKQEMENLKMAHEANMAQMQQIPDQLAGPVYALKKALDHTQQKLENANKSVDKYKTEYEVNKIHLADMKEQLEKEKGVSQDLMVRLDMAKLSYKVKYVEANKYKKELKNAMVGNKQGYRKVCEDIDQQLKVYETQQKLSDSSICVEPSGGQVEAAEKSHRLTSIEQSAPTVAEETKERAHNSLLQQLDLELAADESESVYMDMENCNETVLDTAPPTAATSGASGSQCSVVSPPIDLVWKRYDMCLVNCSDGYDRLACVVDIEKDISMLSLRVVYQQEVGLAANPSEIYKSGSMQVMTQLYPEKYPVQKVRPYNGEQVPRDVWMTLGGYIFGHPNERLAMENVPNDGANQPLSLEVNSAHVATNSRPPKSIGGVGWGSFNAQKLSQPIKSLFSTGSHFGNSEHAPESSIRRDGPVQGFGMISNAQSQEQFGGASSDSMGSEENKCLLCEKTFPKNVNPEEFNAHMEEHYGPSCPFCMLRFPKSPEGEQQLMHHVNGHLLEMGDA